MALGVIWTACSAPMRFVETLAGTSTLPPTLTLEPSLFPTPIPSPTVRPTPSRPPLPTSDTAWTPFPTFSISNPTAGPAATAAAPLDCRLDWQSPGNGAKFEPYELFTVGWHVTNTGAETWSPASVEFTYLGGAKPIRDSVVRLKSAVAPGQAVVLTAEMRAPGNPALYTTHWGLRQGDAVLCRVSVSIYVK